MRATCSPMPDAAPVTTACLPSYPRTSSIGRRLTTGRDTRHPMGYTGRMSISSFVARPLLAGMFVYGGLYSFRNPAGKVPRAEKVAPALAVPVGVDADVERFVQSCG